MAKRLLLALLLACGGGPAAAQEIIAELSRHLVAITTGFTGTEMVLFGSVDGDGDVVVIVRGPESERTVRRKSRIAGLWINAESVAFANVPGFFAIAATRPLDAFVPEALARREQIGAAALRLETGSRLAAAEIAAYRAALLRNMEAEGVYLPKIAPVRFLGSRLFRTDIQFPANVPTGKYNVNVLLVRGGQVVSAATVPLEVDKVGASAEIYDFAHRRALSYGLIAVALAGLFGWGAARLYRRA